MNEVAILSNDINVITAEINSYKQIAGQSIFEIGRRLKHVKENDLVHGEFGKWLESIDMTPRNAQQFMQITEELETKAKSVSHLGFAKLLQIAQLPQELDRQEFIEQKHKIPSTGEQKTVDEMTVRELREVKKALKEAEEQKQRLEQQLIVERNRQPKVIEKVVTKTVEDTSKIVSLESRLNSQKQQLDYVISENEKIKKQLNLAKYTKEQHERLENNIRELAKQRTELQQDIDDIEEITKFIMKIEEIKKDGLAPFAYSNAIRRQTKDQYVIGKLNDLITSIEEWCREMRSIVKEKNVTVLEGEVIDV